MISALLLLPFTLLAVAIPKFSSSVNKARVSEAPSYLSQIASAEAVYNAEYGIYIPIKNNKQFSDELGVNINSEYFAYSVDVSGKYKFVAKATLKTPLGGAKVGDYLWVNELDKKGVQGYQLKRLIGTYWLR